MKLITLKTHLFLNENDHLKTFFEKPEKEKFQMYFKVSIRNIDISYQDTIYYISRLNIPAYEYINSLYHQYHLELNNSLYHHYHLELNDIDDEFIDIKFWKIGKLDGKLENIIMNYDIINIYLVQKNKELNTTNDNLIDSLSNIILNNNIYIHFPNKIITLPYNLAIKSRYIKSIISIFLYKIIIVAVNYNDEEILKFVKYLINKKIEYENLDIIKFFDIE